MTTEVDFHRQLHESSCRSSITYPTVMTIGTLILCPGEPREAETGDMKQKP